MRQINCVARYMATKIIWTFWHQGWHDAPDLVKRCKDSWIKRNPDYQVHALDHGTLLDHIDFPAAIDVRRKDLTVQKISALARLALLARYGGVWVDATVMCRRPLSEWLDEYSAAHFFAFRDPGKNRLLSNWFLAAESDSVLLRRLQHSFTDYFVHNSFTNQGTAFGNALTDFFSKRWCSDYRTTPRWHSWFARKILRVYPYFIFHYSFNKLILEDPVCADVWSRGKPFLAEPPHRLLGFAESPNGIELARREISAGLTPLYKLNWRVDRYSPYWTAVLQFFEEQP